MPQKKPCVSQEMINTPRTKVMGIRVWVSNHCFMRRFNTKVMIKVPSVMMLSFTYCFFMLNSHVPILYHTIFLAKIALRFIASIISEGIRFFNRIYTAFCLRFSILPE